MKKLFGTDGIRGEAGAPPMDRTTVFAVGFCLGRILHRERSHPGSVTGPGVVIGEDTRASSHWIAETVAGGLRESGVTVRSVGVLPTPGLAHTTVAGSFQAGIMVSASHNPYQDNGLKIFSDSGHKLLDEEEMILETEILNFLADPAAPKPYTIPLEAKEKLTDSYIRFLREILRDVESMPARKVVLDCANGAASSIARKVFSGIGVEWVFLADTPDGQNINRQCGSLHLENLRRDVLTRNADIGVAFDGDADRALFISSSGRLVNGDGVLLAAARYMSECRVLQGGAVVGTTMSNLGLERALHREELKLIRADVGDKYVLERMRRHGANLGGEQSGHIIFSDLATTGDGLLTALQVFRFMSAKASSLDELLAGLEVYPQKIRNVPVREKIPLQKMSRLVETIRVSKRELGSEGRIVVRYSGTEPLARIMVEARTLEQVESHIMSLATAIENEIG
jgi:phosphoglucosamine mutase